MPSHTPEERARNAPIRARQQRRNTQKFAKSVIAGNPPKTARDIARFGRAIGATLGPTGVAGGARARIRQSMSAKEAKGILAPRNSPRMSSFEKLGGISGHHNSAHK